MNFKFRQYLSLVAGCLACITLGGVYTFGAVAPYIASYLKYHGNEDIKVVDVTIMSPIAQWCQQAGLILSMYL